MKAKEDGQAAGQPAARGPGRPRHSEPSPAYLARQEEIVRAATEVFGDKGYDVATLDDVAAALDLRKASLYHYISSKAHLLYLIFDRAITGALRGLERLAEIEDPATRLAAAVGMQAQRVSSDPALFRVFFDARPRLSDRDEALIIEKERRYVATFAEMAAEAAATGAGPATDPRYTGQAILGMTSWVYKWFVDGRDDAELYADTCVQLVLGKSIPGALEISKDILAEIAGS